MVKKCDYTSQKESVVQLKKAQAVLANAALYHRAFSVENFHDIIQMQEILKEMIQEIENAKNERD